MRHGGCARSMITLIVCLDMIASAQRGGGWSLGQVSGVLMMCLCNIPKISLFPNYKYAGPPVLMGMGFSMYLSPA